MPFEGNGFNYEAEHFGQLLEEDKKNSEVMPLEESLSIARTMDKIRESCGFKYPFEE